jgi:hypothetical protein
MAGSSFYDRDAVPDFKQIVEKSLALFGVFTGVTLSFYIKDFLFAHNIPDGFAGFSACSRAFITIAVIALLLRYIVGSAVHLNATYVAKTVTKVIRKVEGEADLLELVETRDTAQKSLSLLFFDIVVLVIFGVVAVSIIYSANFSEFMWRSLLFIGLGFGWGLIALFRPKDRPIAKSWLLIDGGQGLITLGIIYLPVSDLGKTAALAIVYLVCLFLDFCVVSRPPVADEEAPAAEPVAKA